MSKQVPWVELARQYKQRYEACKDHTSYIESWEDIIIEHDNGDCYILSDYDNPHFEAYDNLPNEFTNKISFEEYLVVISQDW